MTTKRKPLVLGNRSVDAEVTPPPEGYVPAQNTGAQPGGAPNPSPADDTTVAPPPVAANADASSGTAPAGDALDPRDLNDAGDAAAAAADAQSSARNAQNVGGRHDDGGGQDDEDDPEAEYTYASENQVQAARLVLRAFAKARDSVVPKATAARAAIAELEQMGGNRDQLRMVLADARVKPREIGLRADFTPL